jgi:hypothetical protein|tara:strand:+ start:235 stop:414 length:180 start_codon:yes stop_codon:yes gene_type:complete
MDNFKKYFKSLKEKSGAAVSEDELERFAQQRETDVIKSLSGAQVSEKEAQEIMKKLRMK